MIEFAAFALSQVWQRRVWRLAGPRLRITVRNGPDEHSQLFTGAPSPVSGLQIIIINEGRSVARVHAVSWSFSSGHPGERLEHRWSIQPGDSAMMPWVREVHLDRRGRERIHIDVLTATLRHITLSRRVSRIG